MMSLMKTIQKIKLSDISRLFVYLFVIFLPFQVKTLLLTPDYYYAGFFNPYLSHSIYLTDIFFILACLFFGISLVFENRKNLTAKNLNFIIFLFVVLFLGFYVFSILDSVYKLNSVFYVLRFFEFFVIYLFVSGGFVDIKKLLYSFVFSVSVSAFIGILQYGFGESVGLGFLGEPNISKNALGVAKISLFSDNFLRIYGTFSHPNILAGYLVFAMFFTMYLLKKSKNEMKVILGFVFGIEFLAFILTFSRSAFLALIIGMFFYYMFSKEKFSYKKLLLFFLLTVGILTLLNLNRTVIERLFFFSTESFTERQVYFDISKNVMEDQPFGVGAGNFSFVMQKYSDLKLEPWQYQPVHNVFMLICNEIGVFGAIIFVFMFVYIILHLMNLLDSKDFLNNRRFLAVLLSLGSVIFVIGIFDHYFISLYQGQALLWLYLALVTNRKSGLNLTLLR